MKPFPSCDHPLSIKTLKGIQLVSCGHCVQCKVTKSKSQTLLLDLESEHTKYQEFLTLTYADEFTPYIDMSELAISDVDNKYGWKVDDRYYPIHFGNRIISRWNPRSKKLMYLPDPKAKDIFFKASMEDEQCLDSYNKRIAKYYERYPWRHRKNASAPNHVRILWYDDVLRFHDRLRNYAKKEFKTTFRYYTVGEYGSNSLCPHFANLPQQKQR